MFTNIVPESDNKIGKFIGIANVIVLCCQVFLYLIRVFVIVIGYYQLVWHIGGQHCYFGFFCDPVGRSGFEHAAIAMHYAR